jgi:hypothetical protein
MRDPRKKEREQGIGQKRDDIRKRQFHQQCKPVNASWSRSRENDGEARSDLMPLTAPWR